MGQKAGIAFHGPSFLSPVGSLFCVRCIFKCVSARHVVDFRVPSGRPVGIMLLEKVSLRDIHDFIIDIE